MNVLLHIENNGTRQEVVVVYEAGPLGYTLYRKLKALGCFATSVRLIALSSERRRRKNNKIDARTLTSKLFNYLDGDRRSAALARCRPRPRNNCVLAVGNTINWLKNANAWAPKVTRCS